MTEFWYRYENLQCAPPADDYDDPVSGSTTEVRLTHHPVRKVTAKGVWIYRFPKNRFILRNARKRWACPTIEEAKASFIARKKLQISFLKQQISNAERALEIMENTKDDKNPSASYGCSWGRNLDHAGNPSAATGEP